MTTIVNKHGLIRWIHILILCLGSLQLVGCGSGGGANAVSMTSGVEYAVAPQDRIVSTSSTPALLEVRHDFTTDIRYVTLLEGSATLLYGNIILQ